MIVAAAIGLFAGMAGGRYGAKASAGLARNLRGSMFDHIQTFSFANIDKFSTAGLVTRLTTDVTNIQNAYQMMLRMMMRAPASMVCALVMAFTINATSCQHLSRCSSFSRRDPVFHYPPCHQIFPDGISKVR